MANIKEMDIEHLQYNTTRRNIVMDLLRKTKRELNRVKEDELDNIAFDDSHLAADAYIRRKYSNIIDDIDALLDVLDHGDWSLAVESTKEREKLYPCWVCGKVGCTEHK